WHKLKSVHEELTTGGLMYWLCKSSGLTLRQMEGDDTEKHIDLLLTYYDHLSSLTTKENPLTPDAILMTALFISLPLDWISVINHLMECDNISLQK
ncbi:hypothetical protein CROQUDRAFT_48140, partial [Cronartium quercuum f. sp. fusiforme G11]